MSVAQQWCILGPWLLYNCTSDSGLVIDYVRVINFHIINLPLYLVLEVVMAIRHGALPCLFFITFLLIFRLCRLFSSRCQFNVDV